MIPHLFHFIWLGGRPLPAPFDDLRDRWLELHPGWEARVWRDADFGWLRHQGLFDGAAAPAQRADIARYEILYEHGGVYLDTDMEALRNIEPLIEGSSFFAGREPSGHLGIAIIGSERRHPALLEVTEALPGWAYANRSRGINEQTGPHLFAAVLDRERWRKKDDVRFFPSSFFYPYDWDEPDRANEPFPTAYAVHRWHRSWGVEPSLRVGLRELAQADTTVAVRYAARGSMRRGREVATARLRQPAGSLARRITGRIQGSGSPAPMAVQVDDQTQVRVPELVSVVVPTWNRAQLLRACLDAILIQSYPTDGFEVVVVDDGSDDDTRVVLDGFMSQDPRVRMVSSPHRGLVPARMSGAQAAKGDLLVFVDDDARPEPDWLGGLVRAAILPGVGVAGGRVKPAPYELVATIDDRGRLQWSGFDAGGEQPLAAAFVAGGNMAVWRDALDAIGGFDPAFTKTAWREETDVCVRASRQGFGIRYTSDAAVEHVAARWHGRAAVLPSTQFSIARNNGYFVGKHFRRTENLAYWVLVDPWIEPARKLASGVAALALVPVRMAGVIVGWTASGRRTPSPRGNHHGA